MVKLNKNDIPKLSLFPLTAEINDHGHLSIGNCDVLDMAQEYGTPLYVFDEFTIRHRCREFKGKFTKRHDNTIVLYAAKAFLNKALSLILHEEGLGLDVVSGGELSTARSVDFPAGKVYFHGNNKTTQELELALDWGIGRVVVDNLYELEQLNVLCKERGSLQDILLRLTPDVDPHTHRYTTTGTLDSKFGFPLTTGQAEEAVKQAMSCSNLKLLGLHFHLGSPIVETEPYELAMELVLRFAREMKDKFGFESGELSIGGGFAVPYTIDSQVSEVSSYASAIVTRLDSLTSELGMNSPHLAIEPGRAIVAQAGVALYTVGAIKDIPGIRRYVCVDGGMSDNIRPALYSARYEALAANRALEPEKDLVTIAGKLCESADILAKDINLARVEAGDVIAIPVCGAYCLPMSSNYNAMLKPAVVMANSGHTRLIQRRESYQDLTRLDVT